MSAKSDISCPQCEYERNTSGQPVERDGEMQCLDCGSSWRVFGTRHSGSVENIQKVDPIKEIKKKLRKNPYKTEAEDDQQPQEFKPDLKTTPKSERYMPGLGVMISCFAVFVMFGSLYFGVNYLKQQNHYVSSDSLYIGEVAVEEQVRRNGSKVFTVKGLVANPTAGSKPIPTIAIILRQTNGKEITRWHYTSSLASLKAGAKSRFASSIQYDTPIVAYAEAVFKQ